MRLAVANQRRAQVEEKDLRTVRFMIELYCRRKHKTEKGQMCKECAELWEYVQLRRQKCPFKDNKPFCSNCKIHCYKPEMREKIKEVMRYSGPRMMFYDPRIAWAHVFETIARKRREKRQLKAKKKAKEEAENKGGEK